MAENNIDFKQILTDVSTRPVLSIWVNFEYSDPSFNKSIKLEHGIRYKISYVADRALNRIVGIVKDIGKIYNSDYNHTPEYIITVDCSTNYGANVKRIKSSQIRDIVVYVEHMDEDTNLKNTETNGGTTTGKIADTVIEKIHIDDDNKDLPTTVMQDINGDLMVEDPIILPPEITDVFAVEEYLEGNIIIPALDGKARPVSYEIEGNIGVLPFKTIGDITINGGTITGGYISKGDIDPTSSTTGGITYGINESKSNVIVIDDTNTGGKIDKGDVVTFTVDVSKQFSFTKNDDGTYTYHGSVVDAIIRDTHVTGSTSTGGKIVDPVIENPVTYGGVIIQGNYSNDDYNGGTSGSVNTHINNGHASSGNVMPGTDTPIHDDEMKTINGITKGNVTYNGITTGGVVSGGTTIGSWDGRPVSVVDATVTGGVSTGTTITGGTVTGGDIGAGGVINGAVIYGGTGTADITTGGTVTGGKISFTIPDVSTIEHKGDMSKEARDTAININIHNSISDSSEPDNWAHTPDGLIVTWDPNRGVRSNITDHNAHIVSEIDNLRL